MLFAHYDDYFPILYNNFGVHYIDPRLTTIHLEDNNRLLMVQMVLDGEHKRNIGFGTNVSSVIQVSRP